MPRNKHCCMEEASVWSSPPFGWHWLPSKCHRDLLLIMLAPCGVWSCIECLGGNLQNPQRTWQSQTRQCLSHGNDVLQQLLSPETMKMSLLSLRVKMNWRGAPLSLLRCPRSQVGRLEMLGPCSLQHRSPAHRLSWSWEGEAAWQIWKWKEVRHREFRKIERIYMFMKDGCLLFMLLFCIFLSTKASVFQKC